MTTLDTFIATAQAQVGKAYKWGTAGPDTFDCSGLVAYCYGQATGLNISHDSHVQFTLGQSVQILNPGDLLFFDTMNGSENRSGNTASHVGIYVAPGKMVNALNPTDGVRRSNPDSAYFKPKFLGARRLIQAETAPSVPPPVPVSPPTSPPVIVQPAGGITAAAASSLPKAPTGAIKTAAPGGTSFNMDWSTVNQYDQLIAAAADKYGVPFGRIKAVIPVESRGVKTAVQKNNQNGWSYGLMQIVPFGVGWAGWNAQIRIEAGLSATASNEQIVNALYDPAINLKVGAFILKSFYDQYKSWDAANSAFFLGSPDWFGHDTVNFTTGQQYQTSLNGLLGEIWDAAGTGGPTTVPGGTEGLRFGLFPWPKGFDIRYLDLAPNGQGWDDLGDRSQSMAITVCHHTAGNDNRDSVYGLFTRGGGRWGNACTDAVIDRTGKGYLMLDPWGVSKNVTPWASGPATSLKGIGVQIVQQLGANAVNKRGFSCEHCNVDGQGYTDAQIALSAKVYANVITRMHIPYTDYPNNPNIGLRVDAVHDRFAPTSCPGADWPWGGTFHNAWVQAVIREAKLLQTGSDSGGPIVIPDPLPVPTTFTKFGLQQEQIADYFGLLTRYNSDGTTEDLPFSPTGVLSNVWLERFGPVGVFPEAESLKAFDSKLADGKEWYATFEGGYVAFLPIDNNRATWKWLDKLTDAELPKP